MKGHAWALKRLIEEGVMPPIKMGAPQPRVAEENIQRAVAALERRGRVHARQGAELLALRQGVWIKNGCKAKGRSARRLREIPGGLAAFRQIRKAMKSGVIP